MFFDLVDRKLAILDYKNMDLKKSEFFFSKGGSPLVFGQKSEIYSSLFWSKIGRDKVVCLVLEEK